MRRRESCRGERARSRQTTTHTVGLSGPPRGSSRPVTYVGSPHNYSHNQGIARARNNPTAITASIAAPVTNFKRPL